MNLKQDIENHTLDELKELYKIPKTKIQKLLDEQGLEIKYCGRTPYTKQLIPISDKRLAKYQDKKKREKVNSEVMSDADERNWPQCEIDSRTEDLQEYDYLLGHLFNEVSEIQQQINDTIKKKTYQQFMISICKKLKETKDWCGYCEEEHYGKRPTITKFDVSMLTDEMVLGYLSKRLNPLVLSEIAGVLKRNNNEA